MKKQLHRIMTAAATATLIQSASATVLFTDNFDVTSPSWDNPNPGVNDGPNHDAANPGRQGGTLATLGYNFGGNVQVGNTTTYPADSGVGSASGDDMLLAFGATSYINYDFSGATSPLEVTFRGLIASAATEGPQDWVSLSIGNSGEFVNGGGVASILWRASGGIELWNHGAVNDPSGGFAPGLDAWTDYKIVLSDTAGTGSAFTGNGSRADYYANGSFIGTFTMNQLNAGQGYFGFAGNKIVGYDNIQISTIEAVPEPSAVMLVPAGLGLLMFIRRNRRA